jgi:hypothetical protein
VRNKAALVAVGVLAVIQLGFTYLSPMQELFGVASITAVQWAWVLGAGLGVFLLVELEKLVVRRRRVGSDQEVAVGR